MKGPHHVYGLFRGTELLYIGVTNHPRRRRQHHKDTKFWWTDDVVMQVLWTSPRRGIAEFIEGNLIASLEPSMQHAIEPLTAEQVAQIHAAWASA